MANKILIISPFYPPNTGGAETFTEQLAKESAKWFYISVLTYQPIGQFKAMKYEEHYTKKGFLKIWRLSWPLKLFAVWRGTNIRYVFLAFPKLALYSLIGCLKNKYDIVHAQGLISGAIAVILKKLFKCKAYITLLALYEFKGVMGKVSRYVLENCDVIFVEGENGKKNLEGLGLIKPKIKIFNHWVDQSIFKPKPRIGGKCKVLFVGRPIKEKGRHIVEKAERLLDPERFEFAYVEKVKYEELPAIYQNADVLVVPSLYAEGYVRVVAEGAACGCAIIASNKGSLPEMVKGFGASLSPELIPDYLGLMSLPELRESMQEDSLLYAQEHFTNKNAEVFLEEYSK